MSRSIGGTFELTNLFVEGQRIKSGHREFDHAFKIKGTDPPFVHTVLSPSIQQHLLRLSSRFSQCRMTITNTQVEMSVDRMLGNHREYDLFLDGMLACLAQIARCTHIQIVQFGTTPSEEQEEAHTVWNPDVSTFEIPPFALEEIIIHTSSFDFHQVEHFLTYAVSAIGQRHLKQVVNVTVIGDVTRLHRNLHNSFLNVCHSLVVAESPDKSLVS